MTKTTDPILPTAPILPDIAGSYVVVRSSDSGVWIGTLVGLDVNRAILTDAFRIWSWEGALDTTAIAASGVTAARVGALVPIAVVFGCADIVTSTEAAWQTVADHA